MSRQENPTATLHSVEPKGDASRMGPGSGFPKK